jgi:hypothetical protein
MSDALSSPDLFSDFCAAIVEGDESVFESLWEQVDPWTQDGHAVVLAARHNRWFVIETFCNRLLPDENAIGDHFWPAFTRFLEEAADHGHEDLLKSVLALPALAKRKRGLLGYALVNAALQGKETAIDVLLKQGARLSDNEGAFNVRNVLADMVEKQHLGALIKLLPTSDPWKHGDFALRKAVSFKDPQMLDAIINVSDPNHLGPAMYSAVNRNNLMALNRLIDACARYPAMNIDNHLTLALVACANQGFISCLKRLLEITDPNAESGEALRRSIESEKNKAAVLLVAVTDLDVVRAHWVAERPSRWDLIDQLAVLVPEDVAQSWMAKHKGKLPETEARERAKIRQKTSLEISLSEGSTRRRHRP